jgi:transketolase
VNKISTNTYEFGSDDIKSNQINFVNEFNEKNNFGSVRDAYAFYIQKILKKNRNIVLIDADLGTVAKTFVSSKRYNKQFVQVGISEQNMIGVAAGIAQYGKIPVAQSLAVFLTGRPYDQIRESVCYSNLNVKLVGLHAGMTLSPDGATHQTGEDIALMTSLPNMEVYAVSDHYQLKMLLPKFLKSKKPGYLRLFFPQAKIITNKSNFKFRKIQILKKINKINILSYGYMAQKADALYEYFKKKNIKIGVINVHSIKPFDYSGLEKILKKTEKLIILEDHNFYGGLGSIISANLKNSKIKKYLINSNDKFGTTGLPEQNLDFLGLSTKKLKKKILNIINE